jgi:cell division protein FtsQ
MPRQIDKQSKLFFYILLFILLTTISDKSQVFKRGSLIGVKNIIVNGLTNEKNIEISSELKIFLFKNIFFIKKDSFLEIFKKNNLIESFVVKKNYPDSIYIDIKKTDFLALTSLDNKKFFIGSNGRLIKYEKNINSKIELPFVFGRPDNSEFINFKKYVDKSKFSYKDIESIFYFINKRWDIKTKNGILIKLPEINIMNSLNLANKIMKNKEFIDKKIIDLRISKQAIIQ